MAKKRVESRKEAGRSEDALFREALDQEVSLRDTLVRELEVFRSTLDEPGRLPPRTIRALASNLAGALFLCRVLPEQFDTLRAVLREAHTDSRKLDAAALKILGNFWSMRDDMKGARRGLERLVTLARTLPPLSALSEDELSDWRLKEAYRVTREAWEKGGRMRQQPSAKGKGKSSSGKKHARPRARTTAGPKKQRRSRRS